MRKGKETNIIPIVQDLTNPSPALGWAHEERQAFLTRAKSDFVMGLALIHHLCISHNIPLAYIAKLCYSIAPIALVEFIPKEDEQVQRLLTSRQDIFLDDTLVDCLLAF